MLVRSHQMASALSGVLLGCVALTTIVAISAVVSPRAQQIVTDALRGPRYGYAVGEVIDVDRALYNETPFTVIVFARSTCPACRRSSGALRKLAAAVSESGQGRMVLAFTEVGEGDGEFVSSIFPGSSTPPVVHLKNQGLRLKVVPTVALVTRAGLIAQVQFGGPDANDEDAFVSGILAGMHPRS